MMSRIMSRLREHVHSVPTSLVVPSSEAGLCTTCAASCLRRILRDGLPESKMVSLGTFLGMTQRSSQCAFCRLVTDLIRRRWRLDEHPGVDVRGCDFFLSAQACGTLDPSLDEKKQMHRLYVHCSSRPLEISNVLVTARAAPYLDIQLLEEDSRKVGRSKDLHGRRIKHKVDAHLIKRWLSLCETAHGDACETVWWKSGHEDLPEYVRMIDVAQMALVHASPNCRYMALSYVWGGPGEDYWTSTANAKARTRPSGLKESVLPDTIMDAVRLTRQIGERYLWVDALCIIQDSHEDKTAQISIMDRVYGRAALTIIAATGASVRAGLPGIKTPRTLDQRVECIQGLHLSIPLPSLSEAATDSVWNTRGWAFQEALLSRRRLYFTKHQIYFQCERDVWCEDFGAESKTLKGSFHPLRYLGYNICDLVSYTALADMNLKGYEDAVENYSQRHLSVDSDIIAAITALTNAMTRALEPPGSNPKDVFRFGMWMRNLDLSLLWQPRFDAILTRRILSRSNAIPSWAWSGWKGAVQYGKETQMLDGVVAAHHDTPTESLITDWHLANEDGNIIRLDVTRIPPSWNPDDAQRFAGSDHPWTPFKYVAPRAELSDPLLDLSLPNGTLVFRTQCACFQAVKLQVEADEDGFPTDSSGATAHAVFHILPVDEEAPHYAGRIILPISTPSPFILELVVLSRCDGTMGLWNENRWGKRYYGCTLHVMALQGMCDDSRVSERIGLGAVVESAWMESKARERVVLLA